MLSAIAAFLVLLALPMTSQSALGAWTRIPNPPGASVSKLIGSGEILYAGLGLTPRNGMQHSGYYQSRDAGRTWAPVWPDVFWGIPILGVDGDILYARSRDSLIVKTPGKEGWSVLAPLYSSYLNVGRGLILTSDFWGNEICSRDSGRTWQRFQTPHDGSTRAFLAITPDYIFLGYDNSYEAWRSGDKGLSWQRMFRDSTLKFLPSTIFVTDDCVLLSNMESGYRSLDKGNTWEPVTFDGVPTSQGPIHAYGRSTRTLFLSNAASTNRNFWYASRDSARSWKDVTGNLYATFDSGPVFTTMYEFKNRMFAYSSGIRVSDDFGATWTQSESGLPGPTPIELRAAGPRLAVRTPAGGFLLDSSSTAYSRLEPLRGFRKSALGQDDYRGARMAFDGANLFVRSREDTSRKAAGLMVSPDGGLTWRYADSGLGAPEEIVSGTFTLGKLAAGGGVAVVHGGKAGLYSTGDAGRNWTRLSAAPMENFAAAAVDGDGIYVWNNATPSKPASLQYSEDDGLSWTELARPSGIALPTGCSSILLSPTHVHLVMIDTGNAVNKAKAIVLVSKANPADWRAIPMPDLEHHFNMYPIAVKGPMIFAATKSSVLFSDDTGYTWKSLAKGLDRDSNQIYSLTVQGESLVAGSSTGKLYRLSLSDTGPVGLAPGSESKGIRKAAITLEVRRHPGDPAGVHFQYRLSAPAEVALQISDIRGRRLKAFRRKQAVGTYDIRWEMPPFQEKIFYRFTASGAGGKPVEASGWFTR